MVGAATDLTHVLMWMFLTYVVWEIVTFEFYRQGLWVAGNGRMLSFCDSVYGMYRYRDLKPMTLPDPDGDGDGETRRNPRSAPMPGRTGGGSETAETATVTPATMARTAAERSEAGRRSSDGRRGNRSPTTCPTEPEAHLDGAVPLSENRPRSNSSLAKFYSIRHPQHSPRRKLALIFWAAFCKFGGGTMVSLLLFDVPVWLKGSRHIVSFLISFAFVQLFPGDAPYQVLKNNFAARAVLFAACAMYKLRKIVFSVMHPQFADQNWHYKVLVAFVALEGNSMIRKIEALRAGNSLAKLSRNIFSIQQLPANINWLVSQYAVGIMAILLVGAGQKCWLCPNTSWVDYVGQPWTPIPVRLGSADPAIGPDDFAATLLAATADSGPETYTWLDDVWSWMLEYAFHPAALVLLEYRFLRQLDWSWVKPLLRPLRPMAKGTASPGNRRSPAAAVPAEKKTN
jgi:hypothetical protein